MSASYVGSSGSSSGASSSGNSGGSSALTMSILGSVGGLAQSVILGGSSPSLSVGSSATPPKSPKSVATLAPSGMTTWIVLAVVIVIGLFAFKKL